MILRGEYVATGHVPGLAADGLLEVVGFGVVGGVVVAVGGCGGLRSKGASQYQRIFQIQVSFEIPPKPCIIGYRKIIGKKKS